MIVAEGITELRIYCADAGAWRTATDLTRTAPYRSRDPATTALRAMLAERLALGKAALMAGRYPQPRRDRKWPRGAVTKSGRC